MIPPVTRIVAHASRRGGRTARAFLPLVALPLLLTGCDQRSLEQRTEEIRQLSAKEDRAYTAQAIEQIKRKYWTLRHGEWFGKLPDGVIIRLASPHATAAPLPSSAFYSGWHLQLTLSSQNWTTDPPSPNDSPYQIVYAITRHSPTNWDIRVIQGSPTSPLRREDAPRLEGQ